MEAQQTIHNLKSKITDQEEQIQTLIKKRREDLEKLKENERTKLQLDQVNLSFPDEPSYPRVNRSVFSYNRTNVKHKSESKN